MSPLADEDALDVLETRRMDDARRAVDALLARRIVERSPTGWITFRLFHDRVVGFCAAEGLARPASESLTQALVELRCEVFGPPDSELVRGISPSFHRF